MNTVHFVGVRESEVLCTNATAADYVALMRKEPDFAVAVGDNRIGAIRCGESIVGFGFLVAPELVPALRDREMRKLTVSVIREAMASIGITGPVCLNIQVQA